MLLATAPLSSPFKCYSSLNKMNCTRGRLILPVLSASILTTFLIVVFEHFLFPYIQSLVLGSIALLFEGRVTMVRSYCKEKGRKDSA